MKRTDTNGDGLTELIDELLSKSVDFARLWERYDVRAHRRGTKRFRHPQAGDLTLGCQSMLIDDTADQRLVACYAESGSPDHAAMTLLDSTASRWEPASLTR